MRSLRGESLALGVQFAKAHPDRAALLRIRSYSLDRAQQFPLLPIDRAHDEAEARVITCPVRSLWGGAGGLPRFYADPLEPWRTFAPDITGRAVEGASHFLVEDAPEEVLADLLAFFSAA
jgi:pimeloyl-ACP methyl ester carboxylesterase